jgi:hypothetical protein
MFATATGLSAVAGAASTATRAAAMSGADRGAGALCCVKAPTVAAQLAMAIAPQNRTFCKRPERVGGHGVLDFAGRPRPLRPSDRNSLYAVIGDMLSKMFGSAHECLRFADRSSCGLIGVGG